MAAWSVGVLVIAPANIPSVCAGMTPNALPAESATPSEHRTATAPSAFHFRPAPRRPAKNCLPYWMPMP
jgi:hypothetical protein